MISSSDWSSSYAFLSLTRKVIERMSFIGIELGKLSSQWVYIRCQKSSIILAGIRPDLLISAATGVLEYISVLE